MNRILLFAGIGFLSIFLSCAKSNDPGDLQVHGKYSLVLDSNYSVIISELITVYNGTGEDYWDFRSNGFVYTKEGSKFDTISYSFPSRNIIMLQRPKSYNEYDTIYNNSMGLLVLSTAHILITPGGFSDHTVELK